MFDCCVTILNFCTLCGVRGRGKVHVYCISNTCTNCKLLPLKPASSRYRSSHVTRHTSHVTRHTSHFTLHTSHITRHTPLIRSSHQKNFGHVFSDDMLSTQMVSPSHYRFPVLFPPRRTVSSPPCATLQRRPQSFLLVMQARDVFDLQPDDGGDK